MDVGAEGDAGGEVSHLQSTSANLDSKPPWSLINSAIFMQPSCHSSTFIFGVLPIPANSNVICLWPQTRKARKTAPERGSKRTNVVRPRPSVRGYWQIDYISGLK